MRLSERRATEFGFPDLLLADSLVADGVLLQQDGSFLAVWRYAGPDMASCTPDELAGLSARINEALKLGSNWMLQFDAIRSESPGYSEQGAFPDPVTAAIDAERREQFLADGDHYETEYFVTVTHLPPSATEEKLKGWIFNDGAGKRGGGSALAALAPFERRVESLELALRTNGMRPVRLKAEGRHDHLLRFIRRCITGLDYPFLRPDVPACLQDLIACQEVVGGIEPIAGGRHLRVIAVDGFPDETLPGLLTDLDSLPMEYRWNSRAILLDTEAARPFLERARDKWKDKVYKGRDKLLRRIGTGEMNADAVDMAEDAREALKVNNSGAAQSTYYTNCLVLMDDDLEQLRTNVRLAMNCVHNVGFSCRLETVNAMEAWRGTWPGDGYRNVRRSLIHTLNLADMLPLSSVWTGHDRCPSRYMPPNSPPLLYGATTGATPFRFNLHVGDLGHTLIVGPPGAGKSTSLALIVAQFFRYPNAQVFAFDKGKGLLALTLAAGGEFHDIGSDDLSFCPLAELDTPADLTWAATWLEAQAVMQGAVVGPVARRALVDAVKLLANSRVRTLTDLVANLQSVALRAALHDYTLGGTLGHLLDAKQDGLRSHRLVTFEVGELMKMGEKAIAAVLPYLFRWVERRLDGSPTLVVLDEAWLMLRHPAFREKVREWLKTLRIKNAACVLATQNLTDVAASGITDVVLADTATTIILPDAKATHQAVRELYVRLFRLNDREIEAISVAQEHRDYYVTSAEGRRWISLGLGNVALAFTGVASEPNHAAIERLVDQYGAAWPAEWLRTRGEREWAAYLESKMERPQLAAAGD